MTKKEAIRHIEAARLMLLGKDNQPVSDLYYALIMAIEALEKEPCEDCISRQASYKEIESKGTAIKKAWIATRDERIRESLPEFENEGKLMKIIIEIPKEMYKEYKNKPPMLGDVGIDKICQAISKGIPLPKGHGRLIDAYDLRKEMYTEAFIKDSDMQRWYSGCWIRYKLFENALDNAPTIIEADEESEVLP